MKNNAYICIWSNDKATEMVRFYKSIFKNAKVGKTAYWGTNPMNVKVGSVLTTHITIRGQKIMLLNGFMERSFNESISIVLPCKNQNEIDYFWKKLTANGGRSLQCGWVVDRYGIHWQIAPEQFDSWNTSKNTKKKEAVMHTMWKMTKLNFGKLKKAYSTGVVQ